MAEVCISRNFDIVGGDLSVAPWSVPRHVVDVTQASTGDGTLTQQTTLPGKLMIDRSVSWVSDSPLPTKILARIQRGPRAFLTSNPNLVQFRDRYTTAIDETPRVPDTSNTYLGAYGGGVDRITNSVGVPYTGRHWFYEDPGITEDWFGPVPAGSTFNLRYRCYVWTPPPWSNNANNNSPQHSATATNVRIQLIAFPTQDTVVVTG